MEDRRNSLSFSFPLRVEWLSGELTVLQISGGAYRRTLDTVKTLRPSDHLGYFCDPDGDVGIKIYPEILFLDFDTAINHSNLLGRNLNFDYLSRGGQSSRKAYNFVTALIGNLDQAGHMIII